MPNRDYAKTGKFEILEPGGYYNSLPGDPLRSFIDTAAEVQRALGFANEKDHPEVAPSQFEMNYGYTEASIAADQVISFTSSSAVRWPISLGMTASFLPKPVTGVNGSGMHTNLSDFRRRARTSSGMQKARRPLAQWVGHSLTVF